MAYTQIGYLNLELSTQELIQKEEKQASSYIPSASLSWSQEGEAWEACWWGRIDIVVSL